MRRPHLKVLNPSEVNSSSPPRIRQRMDIQLFPCKQSSFEIETTTPALHGNESEETCEYTPWQPVNVWNPWTDLPAREKKMTTAEPSTSTRLQSVDNQFRYNEDVVRNKNFEAHDYNPSSGIDEFLLSINGYIQRTPEFESDYEADDEPPMLLDHDFISPIPRNLLCDEQITYEYTKDGEWVGGFTYIYDMKPQENELEMGPSTSKLALQRLLALQESAWMQRPNIVIPKTDSMRSSTQRANSQELMEMESLSLEAQRAMLGLNVVKISIV